MAEKSSFLSVDELRAVGFRSVDDTAQVSRFASIYGYSRISIGARSRIDDFVILSAGEGGIHIGKNVHVACFSSLIGRSSIMLADFCNLSSRVSVYSSNDDYSGLTMTNPTIPDAFKATDHAPVIIERHAIVGCGSVILPGSRLGEGAAVGALSLVRGELEPFILYAGVPARAIRARSRELLSVERELTEFL